MKFKRQIKLDWEKFVPELLETEKEWDFEGLPVLKARIKLYLPPNEKPWRRIRSYYALQKRYFLKYCEAELLPWARSETRVALENSAPTPYFQAELYAHETERSGKIWSLYIEERETGTPDGEFVRRWGDTWDMTTGFAVPLSSLFPARSHWKACMIDAARNEIARQERRGEAKYHPGYEKLLKKYWNPRNFYIMPEHIAYFFPMYAIAPAVEKTPVFYLPRDLSNLSNLNHHFRL